MREMRSDKAMFQAYEFKLHQIYVLLTAELIIIH
jgi:hypothetical protein